MIVIIVTQLERTDYAPCPLLISIVLQTHLAFLEPFYMLRLSQREKTSTLKLSIRRIRILFKNWKTCCSEMKYSRSQVSKKKSPIVKKGAVVDLKSHNSHDETGL